MTSANTPRPVSRRTALAGLGAGGLGVALSGTARHVSAQDTSAMTNHPMVGTWLSGTGPNDLALVHWDADGHMDLQGTIFPISTDGVLTYNDQAMGVWEPVDDHGIHITFTWATRDAAGAVTGTTTVDAYPVANAGGDSFRDDGTRVVITVRDPNGVVTDTIKTVPPVNGVRVRPGNPGYADVLARIAAEPGATPTS